MKEAFLKHIQSHEKQIYKICHFYADKEADRQDLCQEILLQLWKSYPNFRGESSFNTWLYQVAINTAITGIKKDKKHLRSYNLDYLSIDVENKDANINNEELFEELYVAIERLNEIEKAIVVLYIDGQTYADMEEILGIKEPTLRVKMNRIKEKLRQFTKNI